MDIKELTICVLFAPAYLQNLAEYLIFESLKKLPSQL